MVIDTSAFVAILSGEPDAERLYDAICHDPVRLVSAATVIEASLVLLGARGAGAEPELDALLLELDIEVVPVSLTQGTLARQGARVFGRGRHAASLNFGDLFGYALSTERGEPLLYVGDAFARTDVPRADW